MKVVAVVGKGSMFDYLEAVKKLKNIVKMKIAI